MDRPQAISQPYGPALRGPKARGCQAGGPGGLYSTIRLLIFLGPWTLLLLYIYNYIYIYFFLFVFFSPYTYIASPWEALCECSVWTRPSKHEVGVGLLVLEAFVLRRVEWFSTFCDFWKRIYCCRSLIRYIFISWTLKKSPSLTTRTRCTRGRVFFLLFFT